jgi:hypothetical protein
MYLSPFQPLSPLLNCSIYIPFYSTSFYEPTKTISFYVLSYILSSLAFLSMLALFILVPCCLLLVASSSLSLALPSFPLPLILLSIVSTWLLIHELLTLHLELYCYTIPFFIASNCILSHPYLYSR